MASAPVIGRTGRRSSWAMRSISRKPLPSLWKEKMCMSPVTKNAPRSSGSGRVRVACCWKNGVVVDLGDGSYPTQAYGLAVVEGQVFAVGTASKPGEKLSVALWHNGEESALTDGSEREVASALVVVKRSPL